MSIRRVRIEEIGQAAYVDQDDCDLEPIDAVEELDGDRWILNEINDFEEAERDEERRALMIEVEDGEDIILMEPREMDLSPHRAKPPGGTSEPMRLTPDQIRLRDAWQGVAFHDRPSRARIASEVVGAAVSLPLNEDLSREDATCELRKRRREYVDLVLSRALAAHGIDRAEIAARAFGRGRPTPARRDFRERLRRALVDPWTSAEDGERALMADLLGLKRRETLSEFMADAEMDAGPRDDHMDWRERRKLLGW